MHDGRTWTVQKCCCSALPLLPPVHVPICPQAGLEPTHQVVKLARDAGFDNVHDYLVHLVTGGGEREKGVLVGGWITGWV